MKIKREYSSEELEAIDDFIREYRDSLYSISQVAQKLGVSIGVIYGYIKDKKLKAYKIGGTELRRHWRIKEKDLQEFIERNSDNEV